MHNVHDSSPVAFHTRWAMSYLRGPMTRPQVKELMTEKKASSKRKTKAISASRAASGHNPESRTVAPTLDPSIDQRYFGVWKSASEAKEEVGTSELSISYEPKILASGKVRFYDAKRGVDEIKSIAVLADPPGDFGRTNWDGGEEVVDWERMLMSKPDHPDNVDVRYGEVPDSLNTAKEFSAVEKDFSDWLYQNQHFIVH